MFNISNKQFLSKALYTPARVCILLFLQDIITIYPRAWAESTGRNYHLPCRSPNSNIYRSDQNFASALNFSSQIVTRREINQTDTITIYTNFHAKKPQNMPFGVTHTFFSLIFVQFYPFASVGKILWRNHSNETSSAVLSHGTIIQYVVLTFESVDKILWCYHSSQTSLAVLSHATVYLVCRSNF